MSIDQRRRRFLQKLTLAVVSYVLAIPLTYFFVLRVFDLGGQFAALSLAIGLLATAPALMFSARRGYRAATRTGEEAQTSVSTAPTGMTSRLAMAMGGAGLACVGVLIVINGYQWQGAILGLAGTTLAVASAVSMARLGGDADME